MRTLGPTPPPGPPGPVWAHRGLGPLRGMRGSAARTPSPVDRDLPARSRRRHTSPGSRRMHPPQLPAPSFRRQRPRASWSGSSTGQRFAGNVPRSARSDWRITVQARRISLSGRRDGLQLSPRQELRLMRSGLDQDRRDAPPQG